MLDSRAERAVAGVSEQLRALFGARLVAVALYGSAAGADYVPGVSDLNLVVVLEDVDYHDLRALRPYVRRWHKQRVATPLLLDRRFLSSAADVFPMELHDIQAQHRMLFGDDVFAVLTINDAHLRFQCEHEARGKLLRLRALYVEGGTSRRRLRALMLDSLKTFLIIMRNLIRVRTGHAPAGYDEVVETFSQQFHGRFPVMSRLLRCKRSPREWTGDVEGAFRDYLDEVQSLVRIIDQWGVSAASDAGCVSAPPD